MRLAVYAFYGVALGLLLVGVRELLFGFEENRCSMTYMFEYPEYRVSINGKIGYITVVFLTCLVCIYQNAPFISTLIRATLIAHLSVHNSLAGHASVPHTCHSTCCFGNNKHS